MKVASVLCIALLLISSEFVRAQIDGNTQAQLIGTILSKLGSLWQNGQFELLGHMCHYKVSPKIRKFKLKYKGKVWCPGWTGITGSTSKKSRGGAVEHAIRDFVNKASNSGLITREQAQEQIQRLG